MGNLLVSLVLNLLSENRIQPPRDLSDKIRSAFQSLSAYTVLTVSLALFAVVEICRLLDQAALALAPRAWLDPVMAQITMQVVVAIVGTCFSMALPAKENTFTREASSSRRLRFVDQFYARISIGTSSA